jgi:hypothetical protein
MLSIVNIFGENSVFTAANLQARLLQVVKGRSMFGDYANFWVDYPANMEDIGESILLIVGASLYARCCAGCITGCF